MRQLALHVPDAVDFEGGVVERGGRAGVEARFSAWRFVLYFYSEPSKMTDGRDNIILQEDLTEI